MLRVLTPHDVSYISFCRAFAIVLLPLPALPYISRLRFLADISHNHSAICLTFAITYSGSLICPTSLAKCCISILIAGTALLSLKIGVACEVPLCSPCSISPLLICDRIVLRSCRWCITVVSISVILFPISYSCLPIFHR